MAVEKFVVKNPANNIRTGNTNPLFAGIEVNGVIPLAVNERKIAKMASSRIYDSFKSSIRELIANACRAARDAKDNGTCKRARVAVSVTGGKLVISDNGTGMGVERFEKIFSELGTSDNHDPAKPGQFGMGFISFLLISPAATIETMFVSGDTVQRYRIDVDGELRFKFMGEGTRSEQGTTITLDISKFEKAGEIPGVARRILDFCGVDATLVVDGRTTDIPAAGPRDMLERLVGEKIAADMPVYHLSGHDIQIHGMIDEDTEQSRSYRDSVCWHFDDDDAVGFDGKYQEPEKCEKCRANPQVARVLVAGMPVSARVWVPFTRCVINITDERKYMPLPGRDGFSEEGEMALRAAINKVVSKAAAKTHRGITTFEDLVENDRCKRLLLGYRMSAEMYYYGEDGYMLADRDKNRLSIAYIASRYGNRAVFSPSRSKNDEYLEKRLNCRIFYPVTSPPAFEMTRLSNLKAKNKIPVSKDVDDKGAFVNDFGSGDKVYIGDPPEKTVMAAKGQIPFMRRVISTTPPPGVAFIKHVPKLLGHPNVMTLEEYVEELGGSTFQTNKGMMTVSEIHEAGALVDGVGIKEDDYLPPVDGSVVPGVIASKDEWMADYPGIVVAAGDPEVSVDLYARYLGDGNARELTRLRVGTRKWRPE